MSYTILVIDDEKNIREGLEDALQLDGYKVELAENGEEGLRCLNKNVIDLVITDLKMPGISGEEVLQHITTENPGIPVIVLTGHGTIDTAVTAMRNGAYDFLTKPFQLDRLSLLVKRALEKRALSVQNQQLREQLEDKKTLHSMIGKSKGIQDVFDVIKRVADTKVSVLVTGESGVGKELVADALHNLSCRKEKPFIKVHCQSLSESLLESELFGHEKGAFTGAIAQKKGRFELADGGTLFLDEIGEINASLQTKLLRVLQEREFERVGGQETVKVDVRIIAATNRNLKQEVEAGHFREDLYYRLNVVNIKVPPLRERREDILLMAESFLREFAAENNRPVTLIDPKARKKLYSYEWPGNIRELRNVIETAVVMTSGNAIKAEDLNISVTDTSDNNNIQIPLDTTMADAERIVILETLAAHQNNKTKVADILEIGRKTLHRKLLEYGIIPPSAESDVTNSEMTGEITNFSGTI